MAKVVLTSSSSARTLIAPVQPIDASSAHAGVSKVAMNIVSRVCPLSIKLDCNCCHAMASWAILRYSIVMAAVTTVAWDPFLVTIMIKSLRKTRIHSYKHTCHRGTRCQSRPLYKSLKTVRLCRWRWDVSEHRPIRKVRNMVELRLMLVTATWYATGCKAGTGADMLGETTTLTLSK